VWLNQVELSEKMKFYLNSCRNLIVQNKQTKLVYMICFFFNWNDLDINACFL